MGAAGRERLSKALADIPLAVVLLSLTRSLSNANIPPNTEEANTVSNPVANTVANPVDSMK